MATATIGGLLLFTILSPLGLIVAGLLFGVGLIILIVRAIQGKRVRNWVAIVGTSFALMLAFAWITSAIYGGVGFTGSAKPSGNAVNGSNKGSQEATPPSYAEVVPELRNMAQRWHSQKGGDPLLVPSYVPLK